MNREEFANLQEKINMLFFESFQEDIKNIANTDIKNCQKLNEFITEKIGQRRLLEFLLNRELLLEILKSIHEGIEIADCDGVICYVNPAFLKLTGLSEEDRLGKNVYNVSPDGALAKVLETGKAVNNLKNFPKDTSVKLISNAAPICILGQSIGAIATIRNIEDIINLHKQLTISQSKVKNLSEKITNLSTARYTFNDFIGTSNEAIKVILMAKKAIHNNSVVLIQGETGTGKEIIANSIHNDSKRANQPFVGINCSATPENLLESDFFGHEKGAFTGAYKRKIGKFELAHKGTLFLDEIGEMPLPLQSKILRVLQERRIQRVGGEKDIPVDVRIIAATNRDLIKMVEREKFRKDLYYRLNVWNIKIPPLRKRKEDLELLTRFILKKIFRKLGKQPVPISYQALNIIYNYDWPGNVRELENILERAVINCNENDEIRPVNLKIFPINDKLTNSSIFNPNDILSFNEAEKIILKYCIEKYGISYESKKIIADKVGVSLATLYNKLKKYNLSP